LVSTDALIFTDQIDESIYILGGWNTYAYSGQRQLYLSSYYTSFELRLDRVKLLAVLAGLIGHLSGPLSGGFQRVGVSGEVRLHLLGRRRNRARR